MRASTPAGRRRVVGAAAALALLVPLAVAAQSIAITGGKVFPVSGPPLERGTVVIVDGKIAAVGADVPVPPGATRVDASGHWVTPGLFNAATQLGLVEIGAVSDSNDARAKGENQVAAAFRAWEALNPDTMLWAPARNEGVTTVLVAPTGGLIAGQAAVVDLANGSLTQVLRRAPAAMMGQVGSAQAAGAGARAELLSRLRELLEDARVFAARRLAYDTAALRTLAAGRLQLQALGSVLDGKLPLVLDVDRASDIESALYLAREFKLRLVISGGAEAWKVAERLASAKVPVITGALDNIPSSFAALGSRQENAALLRRAGVTVVLVAGGPETFNVRNVRQHAGNAVAYGLPWDEALRAVTLAPAQVFGVDDAVGSLAVGRDANVVVWSGDPFEFSTQALNVFVRGRDVKGPSRQDELTDKYKGVAPRRP